MNTIDAYTAKWRKLLKGVDVRWHGVAAWVFEKEVRHLHSWVDDPEKGAIGPSIKVYIPALRLALAELLPVSAVDQLARLVTWPQSLTIEEVESAIEEAFLKLALVDRGLEWDPNGPSMKEHKQGLARRMFDALRAFEAVR